MAVTLSYETLSITLPSPDFEDTTRLEFNRIQRKTRGGDLIVYKDNLWPKNEVLSMRFSYLGQGQVNRLLDFIYQSLGKDITLLDHEGKTWTGMIVTPAANIVENSRNNLTASFDFIGV